MQVEINQSQKQQKIWLRIISQITLFCFLFSLWQPVYASFTPNTPITENTPHNTAGSANEHTLNLTLDLAALTLEANELTNQNPNTSLDNEPISPLENHLQHELKSAFSENSSFTTQALGVSEKNTNSDIELRAFCQKMNVGGFCQSADPILDKYMTGQNPLVGGMYETGNMNLYSYARANPVNYTDPDGNVVLLIVAGAIWTVGAAITAYDTYQTYKQEGAKGAAKSLARDAVITAATGGVGKIATKAAQTAYKAHKAEKAKDSVVLYRGIAKEHPAYGDALKGKAKPRGGNANIEMHTLGDTDSPYTSWTDDPRFC